MTFFIDKLEEVYTDGNKTLQGHIPSVGTTYWSKLGHTVGQCYKCPDQPVVYLNTPKCASSFMKTQVLKLGWKQRWLKLGEWSAVDSDDMLDIDSIEKIIVVMRDPYDRWLSGVAEFFSEYFGKSENIFEFLEHGYTRQILSLSPALDDHTESQLFFLQKIPLEKCVFFRQEQSFNHKIAEYFQDHLNIPNNFITEKPVHVSTAGNYNGRVKKHLDRLLRKNSVQYMKVLEYMDQDYEFIENMVTFYGD